MIFLARSHSEIIIPASTASTTTVVQKIKEYNALILYIDIAGSGAWTIKIQGSADQSDDKKDVYDCNGALMSTGSISTSRCVVFVGIPKFYTIVATEDSGTSTIIVKQEKIVV